MGHIFFGDGIRVDTQKIHAVQSWPRPTSLTDIRIFLGLGGYYRIFVEGFLCISSPLTKLTQKTIMFQGSEAVIKAFRSVKDIDCRSCVDLTRRYSRFSGVQ